MIAARYPFWRTNPAGFAVSGYWPILTGILAALIGPVILGTVLVGLSGLFSIPSNAGPQTAPVRTLETFGIMLVGSPFLSWVALAIAIPISAIAAKQGLAGWGVAVVGGFAAGMLAALIMGATVPSLEMAVIGLVGLTVALLYWGAIRLVHPTAIGVGLKAPVT